MVSFSNQAADANVSFQDMIPFNGQPVPDAYGTKYLKADGSARQKNIQDVYENYKVLKQSSKRGNKATNREIQQKVSQPLKAK